MHVRQLAARQRARGHEVTVLAPGRGDSTEAGVRLVGRPVTVPYNGSLAPIAPSPAAFMAVRDDLRELDPDIVHVHEPFSPSASMFAAMFARAPIVATFHAYSDRSAILSTAAPALRWLWRKIDVRLAVSRAAAHFVASRLGSEPVQVVPNGVEVELFGDARPAQLPEGRRILFVNRLDPRKGFGVAVRAFALVLRDVPDALLVVAGDGPDRNELEGMPAAIRDRVTMLGDVAHEALPPYHAASDVFIAPALSRESFGIVLVEAMAAALPVVASDIPGYNEVVRHDVDGLLVPPDNPQALAEAVVRVLTDAGLAERLSAGGPERAAEFSWDRVAERIEAIYEDVLSTRARR